ncbi:hypothetical protein TRIP_E110012 [uncultured Spirochaetota bacterium]|nr:hypothetical protein TRIP_E110012 [uncultured Spirochaetota bacterium]
MPVGSGLPRSGGSFDAVERFSKKRLALEQTFVQEPVQSPCGACGGGVVFCFRAFHGTGSGAL